MKTGTRGLDDDVVHGGAGAFHARADDLAHHGEFLRPGRAVGVDDELIAFGHEMQARDVFSLACSRANGIPSAEHLTAALGLAILLASGLARTVEDTAALGGEELAQPYRGARPLGPTTLLFQCAPPLRHRGHLAKNIRGSSW